MDRPLTLVAGEFNSDRNPDLAVGTQTGVTILLGRPSDTFQQPVNVPTQDYPFSLAVGDLNGDGEPDLVTATSALQRKVSVVLILLATISLFSIRVVAQGTDTALLCGTVTDSSGAVVPNVMVTMTNVATGIAEKRPTDQAAGIFSRS